MCGIAKIPFCAQEINFVSNLKSKHFLESRDCARNSHSPNAKVLEQIGQIVVLKAQKLKEKTISPATDQSRHCLEE